MEKRQVTSIHRVMFSRNSEENIEFQTERKREEEEVKKKEKRATIIITRKEEISI